jgi:hypothetical protein
LGNVGLNDKSKTHDLSTLEANYLEGLNIFFKGIIDSVEQAAFNNLKLPKGFK